MKVLNYKDLSVSPEDDFLYKKLMELLQQIKLTQGGTGLDASLRRHQKIKMYAMKKQIDRIKYIEETFFNPDGSIDQEAIEVWNAQHKND